MADACADAAPSLPYVEPGLPAVLTLVAFLLFLNVLHDAMDKLLHAGLLAQLLLGAIFGSPLAAILSIPVETAVQSLGYLGLILLVVEGGMSTRLDILSSPKTLALAIITGCTGMVVPVGISMVLLPFAFRFTYLESFAVGASLSSTSLGTTFSVLNSAARSRQTASPNKEHASDVSPSPPPAQGLVNTRVGTILIGAALLDDIVALVLSSVISTLGGTTRQSSTSKIAPWSVARPIVTSFVLLTVTILVARFAARPLLSLLGPSMKGKWKASKVARHPLSASAGLTCYIAVICAFVSIADEIGSTVLLGAFCAGAFMTYLYSRVREEAGEEVPSLNPHRASAAIHTIQERILVPFFFASIGAAIPIKDLFEGETVWKGILFSGLMAIAKVMACLPVLGLSMLNKRHFKQMLSRLHLSSSPPTPVVDESVQQQVKRPWLPALLLGFSLVARGEVSRHLAVYRARWKFTHLHDCLSLPLIRSAF
jgi:Kef-type K+ transport system membrane component KefB